MQNVGKDVICFSGDINRKNSKYLEAWAEVSNIDFVITSKVEDKCSFTNVLFSQKTQQARAEQVIWGKSYESIFSPSKDFTSVCLSRITCLRIQSGGWRDLTLHSVYFFPCTAEIFFFPSSFYLWWQEVPGQEPNEQHENDHSYIFFKSGCLSILYFFFLPVPFFVCVNSSSAHCA